MRISKKIKKDNNYNEAPASTKKVSKENPAPKKEDSRPKVNVPNES